MISQELIDLLCCPEDKSRVRLADATLLERLNQAVSNGSLTNRAGHPIREAFEAGLVRADGKVFYPIREDIPVMLVEESVAVEAAN